MNADRPYTFFVGVRASDSSALNRGEENLDRINTIYRIMTDKIVIILSILSIILPIFRHLHISTV